jgi:Brp/Blh family beta-carotene 15,15'-monooxygenase
MKTVLHIALLILVSAIFIATREQWMNTMAEFIASSLLIALAGIPHGSLDHQIALYRDKRLRLSLFLLQYIASALFYLLVWALAPGIALILFLILTAWHFGETDFVIFGCEKKPGWMIFLYGWSLTIWLLGQDSAALTHWLGIITRESAISAYFVRFVTFLPTETWYFVLALIILVNGAPGRRQLLVRCAFLLFIYMLSKTSLLTGFILYFAGWHSLNALIHIRTKVFHKTNLSSMMKQAIPTTMAALAFLLVVAWLSNGEWLQNHGLPALFILLSILTLPHMTEMHRLYARKT